MASIMNAKKGINEEALYDENHYCTTFVITVNILIGLALVALEIAQLMYIWSLGFLKFRVDQYSLFNESAPGVWLGFLFVVTAVFGIVAKVTQHDSEKRHIRYTVFATLCMINAIASSAMVAYVGYSLDRMRWDYPYICKGYQHAGTYDHICDYEQGFYIVIGLMVSMMILYCLQMVNSFFGSLYGYRKVCNTGYQKSRTFDNNQYANVPTLKA